MFGARRARIADPVSCSTIRLLNDVLMFRTQANSPSIRRRAYPCIACPTASTPDVNGTLRAHHLILVESRLREKH